MSGWKDWAIGEVVTESDFQSFVQDQVVQRYTDATDRDNTLGANVATGMAAYLETEQLFQVYDGTAWVEISGSGTQISDTPPSDPDVGDTWWDSTNGKFYVYFDSYWVQVQLGEAGPQGESGVLAVTSPITYDAGTSTVGIDETAIAIDQDQVTGLANGTSGYSAVSDGSTLTYQPVSHNYIINGAFDVWQRGTSFTNTAGSFAYHTDRWYSGANAVTANHVISQQTFTPGAAPLAGNEGKFFLRSVITDKGSATIITLNHKVEDVRTLAGQQVTLSFFARADATRTLGTIQLIQDFGSGGSSNVSTSNQTAALTSSWQRFSYTWTLASLSGKTIGTNSALMLYLELPVIDGSTFDIWGVQLEAGSVATPFKRNAPSLQGELAACQRYYFRQSANTANPFAIFGSGHANNSTTVSIALPLKVTMRASPTISSGGAFQVLSGGTSSSTTPTSASDQIGVDTAGVNGTVSGFTAGLATFLRANNDADAYIDFSAEL